MKNTENDNEECKSPWSNTLWMDSFKEGITAKYIEKENLKRNTYDRVPHTKGNNNKKKNDKGNK